jgi:hypothetical protein
MGLSVGTIAAVWGFMMVTEWVVPNILLCKTFGKNMANNCCLKLTRQHNKPKIKYQTILTVP